MTTALIETVQERVEGVAKGIDAYHTNVFVLLVFEGAFVKAVFGPFLSFNSAKDWGNLYSHSFLHSNSFTVKEIMRPVGVEEMAFVITPESNEPTLEDQGIHPKQAQIGDYIDPTVVP